MKRGIITNAVDWCNRKLQGKCKFQGLPISIENERGSYRQGIDEHGKVWRTPFLSLKYGYIRGTNAIDGDALDVYVGPSAYSNKVFVVNQVDPYTGKFDELKCMLGFNSYVDAKAAYIRQYDRPDYFGSMIEMDMATFKQKVKQGLGKSQLLKSLNLETTTNRLMMNSKLLTYLSHGKTLFMKSNSFIPVKTSMTFSMQFNVATFKCSPNCTLANTEMLSNLSDGQTRFFKSNTFSYIPSQFIKAMQSGVFSYGHDLKITDGIVQPVSVFVMDNLARQKRSVQMLGHDVSVFQKLYTVYMNKSIYNSSVGVSTKPSPCIGSSHNNSPLSKHNMSPVNNQEDLKKAKYIKRWKIKGKWYYEYPKDKVSGSIPFNEVVRKYKSSEDFIYNRQPMTISIDDINPTMGHTEANTIARRKPKHPNDPIIISIDCNGKINIEDGNHRYFDAKRKGKKTIKALFGTQLNLSEKMYISKLWDAVNKSSLQKSIGRKYIKKYFKHGRWNYIYPKNGGKRPKGIGIYVSLKNLGGTTGGAIKVRLANGEEKVLKRSTSEGHLRDEYTANRIYKTLGVSVPNVQLFHDKNGNLVQVADFIEGVPLTDLYGDERKEAVSQLRTGFVADALVANWDVFGMDNDNIIWDGSKAWRIDNGGSLRYRAQGKLKGDAFNSDVTEVDSLRDPSHSTAAVFSVIIDDNIRDQLTNVLAKKGVILAGIEDPKLRRTMEQRITNLVDRFGIQKSTHEGSLVKGRTGQWYLLEKGKMIKFNWLGVLAKANGANKKYYSAEEVKARGMRWVTIRGARVLLQGTADGGYVVVGGAGGKLSHLKIENILSREEYAAKRKRIETKQKEETQKLTKEEIAEAAQTRKKQFAARKTARATYTESVTTILGVTPDEIRDNITANQMKELEDKARSMVEARKATKTMDKKSVEQEIEKQSEKELAKAVTKQIKNVEREALNTLMKDYMPEDPNAAPELKTLLDKDKALEVLSARKQFRKAIKAIGAESADVPTDLKIGAVFASVTTSEMDEIQKQIKDQAETAKNIQLYDMFNAQSQAINSHVDQGAISALNGLIGDIYGAGATFTTDTVKALGIEAIARAVTAKIQQDGKGEVVRKALEEYVAAERGKVVDRALKETKKRLGNADNLRELARDKDDAEAILSMASANGHALKQITAAQRALGTAVGSLRAAAHMINALEDPIADVVQVDMGKDLARARERAKKAGLTKGTYSIRTVKRGRGKRLVMEIPKESLNSFFQGAAEHSATDRLAEIKAHKANTGYKPPGIKESIKFDAAQEAGLRFFNEKGRVLLDFEAGIGKTGIAYAGIMDAMANKGAKKILVVTPSATRGDFHKQRETFLEPDMQKLVRQSTANTSKTERHRRHLEQDGIHIISQDALRQDASILKDAGYDMVVVDEIHEMTAGTGAAGRYKAMDQLKDVPLKMAMSGTNIKTAKKELYRKINFVDPDHGMGSMADFEKRYKGLNQGTGIFQDAANDAFRKEIGEWVYTQKNQLPIENKVNTLRIPMSTEQRSAYAASERQYRDERDQKIPGASARRDSRNYSILSNGFTSENKKVDTIIDTMKNSHPGEKAVIHVSQPGKPVLKAMKTAHERLIKEFGKGSVSTIHGGTSPGELTKIKAAFNDPGNPLRFIIGTKSLESGHNLQAGGSVTFHLDIPESAAAFDQRNARVFRKGQNKDTSTYVLSGVNPMDMRSEDLMATKRKEMSIIGNPRSVTALDDEGFLGMLNKYEKEARSA